MAPATSTVSHAPGTLPPNQEGETFVPAFRIRSYEAADNKAVCELFAEGMLFYAPAADADPWLHSGFHEYVQKCYEGDLDSIETTYMGSGGHFWVVSATTESGEEEIAAMIALEGKGEGKGELRRLSVKTAYRRHGLGAKLVDHVEQWASSQGFTSIQLNTDCAMTPALKLYDRLGYTRTHHETIREEPSYYLVWFRKKLV